MPPPRESNTAPTDYESKEHIRGVPQSQSRRALLIAHTVREFGKLRRFGQNIPQQEVGIKLPIQKAESPLWIETSVTLVQHPLTVGMEGRSAVF